MNPYLIGEKFLTNGTGLKNVSEKRNRLELYHLQNTITLLGKDRHFSRSAPRGSLALVNQTNGTKNFCRFGKNGKKVIPPKVLLFFRKFSTGINRSIWIIPGITGFSIRMVSAQYCRCSTGLMNYVPKEDYEPLSETGKIERHRNFHLHLLNLIPADIMK